MCLLHEVHRKDIECLVIDTWKSNKCICISEQLSRHYCFIILVRGARYAMWLKPLFGLISYRPRPPYVDLLPNRYPFKCPYSLLIGSPLLLLKLCIINTYILR